MKVIEIKELKDFIEKDKFHVRKTDGWSYLWQGDVVSVDDLLDFIKTKSKSSDK